VTVNDVLNESTEDLEFRDRVVTMSIGFGYLVVTTGTQCCIYNLQNLATPTILEIKDVVSFILQSDKYFLTVDNTHGIQIFTYEGRPQGRPAFQGMKPELLNPQIVSLGEDYVACVDLSTGKTVRVFDVQTGKEADKPVPHTVEIAHVMLSRYGGVGQRKLIVIDKNRDLHVTHVGQAAGAKGPMLVKLGTMVDAAMWNDETDALAALLDGKFTVWYYPNVVFVDRDLINQVRVVKDGAEYGTEPQLVSFVGNLVCVRRADGTLLYDTISPYPAALYELVGRPEWERAIQLCRHVKDQTLWACLAAMALKDKELNTAEVAFAAIDEIAKLKHVQYIIDIPTVEGRNAELALWRRRPDEAEQILTQGGFIYRAIRVHLRMFNWDRALELAVQHRQHIDTVCAFRQRHLDQFGRGETNPRFLQYAQGVTIDWAVIEQNIEQAKQKELQRSKPYR